MSLDPARPGSEAHVTQIVSREGIEFLATMPVWADERTRCQVYERHDTREAEIVIVHPEHPPHRLNRSTKTWEEIKI